jgi:diphthine-ammonia ligase
MLKNNLFCSWSGGKDSCLSLYKALKTSNIVCLVTAMVESGEVSRSHGLTHNVLRAQADALNIPLLIFNTSWEEYEKNYLKILGHLNSKHFLDGGVFGDIDIEDHKEWCVKLCNNYNMKAHHPLWQQKREGILSEFLELGFKAKIISVNEKKLHRDFLGRELDKELIEEFRKKNVDICGENGEYHTVVYDGPIFAQPLALKHSEVSLKNGYWVLEVNLG